MISVRLDDDTMRALRAIEATGMSRSDAIRSSVVAAAVRLRSRRALAREAAALEANPQDRAEMLEIEAMMEALSAPW